MSIDTKLLHWISKWIVLAIIIVFHGMATAQQDLRPLASTLASQIAESGKRSVAVVDFTDLQGNPTELGRYLAEELSVALAIQAKTIKVVDRTHLKAIIQEHKLSSSGLIDPQTARRLGQIAGVDVLVTGTMVPFNDNVRLSVKALDTSTAQILGATMHDVPLTQRIREMIGANVDKTPPPPPPPSAAATVRENGFVFVVNSCRRSGENLTCSGSITNTYSRTRQMGFGATMIDNENEEYMVKSIQIGSRRIPGWWSNSYVDLEPGLTVKMTFSAEGGSPRASAVSLVLQYAAQAGLNNPATPGNVSLTKVYLRNIVVARP